MLVLVVARSGSVSDGVVALLRASSEWDQIVQVENPNAAWDFVQTICPEITIIHAAQLLPELTKFISREKKFCQCPLLVIVNSEEDRKTAVSLGADVVVLEGIPSAKLASHIKTLLQQIPETKTVESNENTL